MRRLVLFNIFIKFTLKKLCAIFSRLITSELIIEALQKAYTAQKSWKGLPLRNDFGSQYISGEFTQHVHKYEIKHLFSQKDCFYDDASIDMFHTILQKKCII